MIKRFERNLKHCQQRILALHCTPVLNCSIATQHCIATLQLLCRAPTSRAATTISGLPLLVGDQPLHRLSRDIGIRIRLRDTRAIHGMDPRKTHLTRGDLAMTEGRLILGSEKGLLLDIREGHGRPITSARCTGPGRLVLEGDIPDSRGDRGLYRFELVIDQASEWAKDLRRFVRADDNATRIQGSAD